MKKILITFSLAFALFARTLAQGGTYSTNFPLTENPISENGAWINGKAVGLDWSDVSTTGGFARGQQTPDAGGLKNFNDATALLAGSWGPDQTAQAVVRNVTTDRSAVMEVEIRLRSTMTAHNSAGYEVYWSAQPANPYLTIARWNGVLGSYANLAETTQGVSIKTGDTLKASIVGTVITAWINGVQKLQYNTAGDSIKFSSGSPGIGFYLQNSVSGLSPQADYGFTSFTVSDGGAGGTKTPAPPFNVRIIR